MRRLVIVAVLGLVFCAGLIGFFLMSRTGLQAALTQVSRMSGGAVQIGRSDGRILGDWHLQDIRVSSVAADVFIERLSISWQPSRLLRKNVHLADIRLQNLTVTLKDKAATSASAREPFILPELSLPFSFVIGRIAVEHGSIVGLFGDEPFVIDQFSAGLSGGGDLLQIADLRLQSSSIGGMADATIHLNGGWPVEADTSWWVEPPGCSRIEGTLGLAETLVNPLLQLQITEPSKLQAQGRISELFGELSYRIEAAAETIALGGICADWPEAGFDLNLSAAGNLQGYEATTNVSVTYQDLPSITAEAHFTGDTRMLTIESARLNTDPKAGSNGVGFTGSLAWQPSLSWHLAATANSFDLTKAISLPDDFPLSHVLLDTEIEIRGELSGGGAEYFADIRYVDVIASDQDLHLTGSARLQGDQDGLVVASSQFFLEDSESAGLNPGTENGSNSLELTGSLAWQPSFDWHFVAKADSFDITHAVLLPDGFPLPRALLDSEIEMRGELSDNGLEYYADIRHLDIVARDQDLRLSGSARLQGDQNGLVVSASQFFVDDGEAAVTGSLSWSEKLAWDARVLIDSFNPASFGQFPTGRVNAQLQSSGSVDQDDIALAASIGSLSGELEGYELAGGGNFVYRDRTLTIHELHLNNGGNNLQIDGTIDDHYQVDFRFNGAELDRILPRLGGNLVVSGNLTGPSGQAQLKLQASGGSLSFEDYSLERFQSALSIQLVDGPFEAEFTAAGLSVDDYLVERAKLKLDGRTGEHRIDAELTTRQGALQIVAEGGLFDLELWRGRLSRFGYQDNQFGHWQLAEAVDVEISAEAATVGSGCLVSEENNICAEASWGAAGPWSVTLSQLRLALANLSRWGVVQQQISGTLQGSLHLGGSGSGVDSASGRFAVADLNIDLPANEYYNDFRFYQTKLDFDLENQNISTRFASRFVDGSHIEGTLELAGAGDLKNKFTDWGLNGSVALDLLDLSPLSVVTSNYLVPSGHLVADLSISGALGSPLVSGDVDLREGGLGLPQLGIVVGALSGSMRSSGRQLVFELDGRSGSGPLHALGEFSVDDESWQGSFTISGSNCEVLKQRAIEVVADPELSLEIGPDGGALSGTVVIQQALLEVEKLDRSESESSDVVFVDDTAASSAWPFNFNMMVNLGSDIRVTGYGLDAALGGKLTVATNPGGNVIGKGFVDIERGTFTVYGNPLKISRGRLSFNGGLIENPGLDIKASKFVEEKRFGYDGVEAGVTVTGSALDYKVELYSIPNMKDADILAYLLLDKPFGTNGKDGSKGLVQSAATAIGLGEGTRLIDEVTSLLPVDELRFEGGLEKEETSLVVGKNLSKDLSVSYDYNLFQNAGAFKVRYEFGKGFSVESRNSIESNGLELLYSFER